MAESMYSSLVTSSVSYFVTPFPVNHSAISLEMGAVWNLMGSLAMPERLPGSSWPKSWLRPPWP